MWDNDVTGLFTYLIGELNKRDVAFIEVNEGSAIVGVEMSPFIKENPPKAFEGSIRDFCKDLFKGAFMANNAYTFESAN